MTLPKKAQALCAGIVTLVLLLPAQVSLAGPLRDRIVEQRATQERNEMLDDDAASGKPASWPTDLRIERDVAYGGDAQQRFDVYAPPRAKDAPVIFLVHGGGWFLGDKVARALVENKVARWVPKGFIVISANYRLLPAADPLEQAKDVARALAVAQDRASSWGGDRGKFILIGHSAGAHLVALLASAPSIASGIVTTPWLGTIALDSAALDVEKTMEGRHFRLHDRAFGSDPAYWRAASPFRTLTAPGRPVLVVCSTQRNDSCPQARAFVAKASALGMRAMVLEQNLSHREVNRRLGEDNGYTQTVESFLGSLDASVARAVSNRAGTAYRK